MYAIVESRGRQYKVSAGDMVALDLLGSETGERYTFDKVLMLVDEGHRVLLGREELDKVKVSGVVTGEQKGKKLIAFKYKKRKGYHRKRGHRENYTLVRVEGIENPS